MAATLITEKAATVPLGDLPLVERALLDAISVATEAGYKIGKVSINSYPIRGRKVGFAHGAKKGATVTGKIVIDSEFVEWTEKNDKLDELESTVRHELAHVITNCTTKSKKRVWHGQEWKDVCTAINGDGDRYYTGAFSKEAMKDIVPLADLKHRLPTKDATEWERGTYRQWLERGYHVIKGQKGHLSIWQFKGAAYESKEDGKENNGFGKAAAMYFNADQVEANTPESEK